MDQTIWHYILQPEQKFEWGHAQTQSRPAGLISFELTVAFTRSSGPVSKYLFSSMKEPNFGQLINENGGDFLKRS